MRAVRDEPCRTESAHVPGRHVSGVEVVSFATIADVVDAQRFAGAPCHHVVEHVGAGPGGGEYSDAHDASVPSIIRAACS